MVACDSMFGLFKPKCPVCRMPLERGMRFCSEKCEKEFKDKAGKLAKGGSCCEP